MIFSILTFITHSLIPNPNFAFEKSLGGGASRMNKGKSAKCGTVGQLAGSGEICNQSPDFATCENQPHNNTLSWFPHQYLVKGCCNGEIDFSPVLIILNFFNPFASTYDTDVSFLF